MNVDATVQITRHNGKLVGVNVIMPTWNRLGSDGKTYIAMPLFGLETFGVDSNDINLAIEEAIMCFCLLAEKNGLGLEFELEFLGWKLQEDSSKDESLLNVLPDNVAFEALMNLGEPTALSLQMA